MKQFVLSDESLNSYGFKVLTQGINIDNFLRNPVMYYNHDRYSGVIGRWDNVEKKGVELFGTPVFDEKDAFGAKIAGKVKDGFIKAASIGIDHITMQEINGEKVVTACTLVECSVCDIPSNKNALMLYHNDKPVSDEKEFIKLFKIQEVMKTDLKPVTDALELSQSASVEDIVAAIVLLKKPGGVERLIDEAIATNIIAKYERKELTQLAAASPDAFQRYLEKRKELAINDREENGLKLTNAAIRNGKINAQAKDFWLRNFATDFETTKLALENIPERTRISDLIEMADKNDTDRTNWTLSDYRKKAPKELRDNPKLYRELLKREQEQ